MPVKTFTQLFHASLDEELVSADWLTSTVIPMQKDKDGDNCGNYRPESLKSITRKTLERALRQRIAIHLEAKQLTVVEQLRFMAQGFVSDQPNKLPGQNNR